MLTGKLHGMPEALLRPSAGCDGLMRAGKIAVLLLVLHGLIPFAIAQEEPPFLWDENRYGRAEDTFSLSYCVDPRDPSWEADRDIGEAIADALLLEPKPFMVESPSIEIDETQLYHHLLRDCRLYFGFKLISQGYPDWLTVTRPLYELRYILLGRDGTGDALADLPPGGAIASVLGSSADLRLIQFNNSRPAAEQWKRFPYGSDEAALGALLSGEADAALVWEPTFARLLKENDRYASLKVIRPEPLNLPPMPVGAVLLSEDTYLRVNVDRAIADLSTDGTIAEILERHGLRAQPGP